LGGAVSLGSATGSFTVVGIAVVITIGFPFGSMLASFWLLLIGFLV
jgi:hypothetical protein